MKNLVRLAHPLKLVGVMTEVVFPQNYVLAAPSPMVEFLYLFPSDDEHHTEHAPDDQAFLDFESFHGRIGQFVSQVEIPESWTPYDHAHEILYLSRKKNGGGDGKANRFRHRFSHGTTMERGRGGWIRIRGRDLIVTDRGIVN